MAATFTAPFPCWLERTGSRKKRLLQLYFYSQNYKDRQLSRLHTSKESKLDYLIFTGCGYGYWYTSSGSQNGSGSASNGPSNASSQPWRFGIKWIRLYEVSLLWNIHTSRLYCFMCLHFTEIYYLYIIVQIMRDTIIGCHYYILPVATFRAYFFWKIHGAALFVGRYLVYFGRIFVLEVTELIWTLPTTKSWHQLLVVWRE